MPHLLIAGKIHPAGLALLQGESLTFEHLEAVEDAVFLPLLPQADALILRTQRLDAERILTARNLRLVVRHGVGYDAVDGAALAARGIPLAIVGDVLSGAVAEQAMMMILALSRRAFAADRAVRAGDWNWRNALQPREVGGKCLLIVGYGRIGHRLAKLAAAFGMQVRAIDPILAQAGWPQGPVPDAGSLAAGLEWADIVSLHMPKMDEPLIGAAELARMKADALLINTSRGGLIDETALCTALAAGHLGGVGLDVFDAEPPGADDPLLQFDRVLTSPHNASLTQECAARMATSSVQNVLDYFAGRLDPMLVVNGVR